jgi:hypothetical protein
MKGEAPAERGIVQRDQIPIIPDDLWIQIPRESHLGGIY